MKALRDKIKILEKENWEKESELSLKKAEINALRLAAEEKAVE